MRQKLDARLRLSRRCNRLMGTLKLQIKESLYSSTVIGTLAVDGWAVTFAAARGLGGLRPRPVPSLLYQINSTPINGQCTNFILFDVAYTVHIKRLTLHSTCDAEKHLFSRSTAMTSGALLMPGDVKQYCWRPTPSRIIYYYENTAIKNTSTIN